MEIKKKYSNSKILYFFCILFLIFTSIQVQSIYLAQLQTHWFHIDFATLIIIYLSIEKDIIFSFLFSVIAASLFQVYSDSPQLFFMLYFMIIITVNHILLKLLVVNSLWSKLLIFAADYLFKYILFYFSLRNHFSNDFMFLFYTYWKEIGATFFASFLVYKLMSYFDSFFVLPGSLKKR